MWIVKIYWKKNVWIINESPIFIIDEMSRHNSLTQPLGWVGLYFLHMWLVGKFLIPTLSSWILKKVIQLDSYKPLNIIIIQARKPLPILRAALMSNNTHIKPNNNNKIPFFLIYLVIYFLWSIHCIFLVASHFDQSSQ